MDRDQILVALRGRIFAFSTSSRIMPRTWR